MASTTPITGPSKTNVQLPPDSSINIFKEIEKILKEIDELIARAPHDDPDYKANMKKLIEIKKFLEKKIKQLSGSNASIFDRMGLRKKKTQLAMNGAQEIITEPSQDLMNINIDDSILDVVDRIIDTYHFIKSIIGSE